MELALFIACYVGLGIILCAAVECITDEEFDGRPNPPLWFAVLIWPLVLVIVLLMNTETVLRLIVNCLVRVCTKVKTAIKTRIQED